MTTRALPLLCGALALGGCAAAVTPVVAVPAPNKDLPTFQKEEAECRSTAAQAAAPADASVTANTRWAQYFASYTQCATAHGNPVQPVPWTAANVGFGAPYASYGYDSPYGYGYPYGYADPFYYGYPFYPGFYGLGYGYGFGFGYGGFFGHRGFRGGYGGFHGGGLRGGGGGGGFHGGGGGFHH